MHVHVPKPLHGWREFVGEVGIIVLGVLIALSAEQIVELVHWKNEVAETREALDASIASSRVQALERMHDNGCIAKQIAAVKRVVATGEGMRSINVVGAPVRSWEKSSWATAMASGVVTHMSLAERTDYATTYDLIAVLERSNADEFTVWSDLASLNETDRMTDMSPDRLYSDLARAAALNDLMVAASEQLNEEAGKLGIRLSPQNSADVRAINRRMCRF